MRHTFKVTSFSASKDANVCKNWLRAAHFHCFLSSASCGACAGCEGRDNEALIAAGGGTEGEATARRDGRGISRQRSALCRVWSEINGESRSRIRLV